MNVITLDHYTNGRTYGHGHSHGHGRGRGVTLKNTSFYQKWKNSEKKHEKEKGGQNNNMLKTCAIVVVAKVIGLVPIIHQSILLNFTKNSLKIKRKR